MLEVARIEYHNGYLLPNFGLFALALLQLRHRQVPLEQSHTHPPTRHSKVLHRRLRPSHEIQR